MSLPIRTHTFKFDPSEHSIDNNESNDVDTCFNCGLELVETKEAGRIDRRYEMPISGTTYCKPCRFFEDYTATGAEIMKAREYIEGNDE